MDRSFARKTSTTLLILFTLLPASFISAETKLSIRADAWAPFNTEPNTDSPGFMIEVAQKAFAKDKITVDYQHMPWARAIREAQTNSIDSIVGASPDDAPGLLYPASPQAMYVNGFILKKDSLWHYTGEESLKKIRLGVYTGYTYGVDQKGFDLDKYISENSGKGVEVISGDDLMGTALQLLERGRIDAIIDSIEVFKTSLKDMGRSPGEFKLITDGMIPRVVYIAFAPKRENSQRFLKILDAGMKDLRTSGELKRLLEKYDLSDWEAQPESIKATWPKTGGFVPMPTP